MRPLSLFIVRRLDPTNAATEAFWRVAVPEIVLEDDVVGVAVGAVNRSADAAVAVDVRRLGHAGFMPERTRRVHTVARMAQSPGLSAHRGTGEAVQEGFRAAHGLL